MMVSRRGQLQSSNQTEAQGISRCTHSNLEGIIMNQSWDYFKNRLLESPNTVQIHEKPNSSDAAESTVLETIANNVSLILVNKYLRILGTGDSPYESVHGFIEEFQKVFHEQRYIVAHDAFGGLFASEYTVFYFSPDNLHWEDLGINYEGFINWIVDKDIGDFYESFLWPESDDLLSQVASDQGVFVYPFFWTKEYNANMASRKIVPYRELLEINSQNRSLLDNLHEGET